MGLDLAVGMLADLRESDQEGYEEYRSRFRELNRYLQHLGLPPHQEPEDCEAWFCDMYSYSGLHYLRRIAAHLHFEGRLPQPGDHTASQDALLERYWNLAGSAEPSLVARFFDTRSSTHRTFDHLILHSDAEGFYLPIDFPDVLFPDEEFEIPGMMVGSCVRVLQECQCLAETLQIPAGIEADAEILWDHSETQGEGAELWERYAIETLTCVNLMRACEKSLQSGAALVFT